jgi:hypothetical protein
LERIRPSTTAPNRQADQGLHYGRSLNRKLCNISGLLDSVGRNDISFLDLLRRKYITLIPDKIIPIAINPHAKLKSVQVNEELACVRVV